MGLADEVARRAAEDVDEAGTEGLTIDLDAIALRAAADVLEAAVAHGQAPDPGRLDGEHAETLAQMLAAGEEQVRRVGLDRQERALGAAGDDAQDLQADRTQRADAVAADHDIALVEGEPVGIEGDAD